MTKRKDHVFTTSSVGFGIIGWLGGAVHVANQPGYGFWDGLIWMYYVGRYVAQHFTQLG